MKRDGSRNLRGKNLGEALSQREQEVCDWVAKGHTQAAIAEQLAISIRTVEVHRQNVFGKLGVQNASALVAKLKEDEITTLRGRIAELETLVENLRAEILLLRKE